MEEIEVPTEHLHEKINELAKEQKEEKKWSLYVAISTALMAVCAAIASLMAGHQSNEALIQQIKASDQWAFYQAKGIKAEIASLKALPDSVQIEKYKNDQQKIKEEAEKDQKESSILLSKHIVMARAVTMFQIAIAISAVSIITERRPLWFVALFISVAGVCFFILGFV